MQLACALLVRRGLQAAGSCQAPRFVAADAALLAAARAESFLFDNPLEYPWYAPGRAALPAPGRRRPPCRPRPSFNTSPAKPSDSPTSASPTGRENVYEADGKRPGAAPHGSALGAL